MTRSLLLAVALVAALSPAWADNREEAVALFNEGLKAFKAGNYDKACPALARSNELHPDSGTRGSLARCYEKQGKLASAWKLWVDLSSTAPVNLRPDAAANAAKLEPKVAKYTFAIVKGAPGLAIALDGKPLVWQPDVAVAIDAGTYAIEASAPNHETAKLELVAVDGKTTPVKIEMKPTPKQVDTKVVVDQPPIVETPVKKSSRKKIGFVVAGAGGAALIGGVVMGVIAKGRNDDAKDLCGGDIDACDPAKLGAAQDKVDSARSAGTISTVAFVAGGALAAVGVYLIVTAPASSKSVAVTPTLTPEGVGFALSRRF